MEHKVTITNALGMGMTIAHEFTKVIDNAEEAKEFGEEAMEFSDNFNNGFIRDSG